MAQKKCQLFERFKKRSIRDDDDAIPPPNKRRRTQKKTNNNNTKTSNNDAEINQIQQNLPIPVASKSAKLKLFNFRRCVFNEAFRIWNYKNVNGNTILPEPILKILFVFLVANESNRADFLDEEKRILMETQAAQSEEIQKIDTMIAQEIAVIGGGLDDEDVITNPAELDKIIEANTISSDNNDHNHNRHIEEEKDKYDNIVMHSEASFLPSPFDDDEDDNPDVLPKRFKQILVDRVIDQNIIYQTCFRVRTLKHYWTLSFGYLPEASCSLNSDFPQPERYSAENCIDQKDSLGITVLKEKNGIDDKVIRKFKRFTTEENDNLYGAEFFIGIIFQRGFMSVFINNKMVHEDALKNKNPLHELQICVPLDLKVMPVIVVENLQITELVNVEVSMFTENETD